MIWHELQREDFIGLLGSLLNGTRRLACRKTIAVLMSGPLWSNAQIPLIGGFMMSSGRFVNGKPGQAPLVTVLRI